MGKTATELGRDFGRTAREMNKLLKDLGFMEGEPGAYRPTALGKPFAVAHDLDNGYGGFAHRQWGWLSWTDGLVDALRASMEANPDAVLAPAPASVQGVVRTQAARVAPSKGSSPGSHFLNKNQWVAAAAIAGLAVATPVAVRVWQEKGKPAASKVRARIAERKSAKSAAGEPEHSPGK